MKNAIAAVLIAIAASAAAGPAEVRAWRGAHEQQIVDEFLRLLAIPNLASDTPNIEKNAEAIAAMLQARGVTTRVIREAGVPPLIVGDLAAAGATKTIAFYAHYDGQPVDAKQWTVTAPWTPVVRDGRIWGRSSSDDKGSIMAMLDALDALRATHAKPAVNIKFVFEGEEEAGSPHLGMLLEKHAAALRADAWFLCDGPVHQSGKPELYFGARGITEVDITVYGPVKGLHDGHYGNWVPNPIVELTHLLDSMRDDDGNILIANFYDDVAPLTASETKALAEIPDVDAELKKEFGIARTEGGRSLNEQILKPALNVRGIAGGRVGETASNTISTEARASIDFRLVPRETPESVREKVERHLASKGWFIVRDTPDVATRLAHARIAKVVWDAGGYPPSRTPMDTPLGTAAASIIAAATGEAPVRMPSLGGSIPMFLFARGGAPVVGLPIANHDNNQHSSNENLRLANLWRAIDIYAARFTSAR